MWLVPGKVLELRCDNLKLNNLNNECLHVTVLWRIILSDQIKINDV
jgi:hypothetical protein